MSTDRTSIKLRIVGFDLPGLSCCPDEGAGDGPVHVGIQHGREVVDLVRGDAADAVFEVDVDVIERVDGPDFRGSTVHGKPGDRFLYLSWGRVDASGQFTMFRRAKLMLGTIDRAILRRAIDTSATVEARLPLTDSRGGPICAAVRPPLIQWKAVDEQPNSST